MCLCALLSMICVRSKKVLPIPASRRGISTSSAWGSVLTSNAARWSVSPVKTDRDRSSFISKEVGSKRG